MLVQKKSKKMQIILLAVMAVVLVLGIIIISGGKGKQPEATGNNEGSVQSGLSFSLNLNQSVFKDPRVTALIDRGSAVYAGQYAIAPWNEDKVPAPTDVSVYNPKIGNKLIIFWKNSGKYATARIYRSDVSGSLGQVIADNLKNELSYQDIALKNNSTYFYTVKLVNADKESENTVQVFGIPTDNYPPAAPSGVSLNAANSGKEVVLAWKNPSDSDFDHVKIYRSEKKGELGTVISDKKSDDPAYTDKNVNANGTDYYYTLTAVDGSGNESSKLLMPVAGNNSPFEPVF